MPLLFVYGTLLPTAPQDLGRTERARLAHEGALLGAATVDGHLIDLGDYPGLVSGQGVVHGVVYKLHADHATLAWLDSYESVTGEPGAEYHRAERPVTLTDGSLLMAWVYLYAGASDGRPRIASGSWIAYSAT